jgi:hypothetical protein
MAHLREVHALQARAINWAWAAPSKPFIHELGSPPAIVGLQRLANAAVRPTFAMRCAIGLEQNTRLQDDVRRRLALRNITLQALTFLNSQFDNISLVHHG